MEACVRCIQSQDNWLTYYEFTTTGGACQSLDHRLAFLAVDSYSSFVFLFKRVL